MQHFVGYARVSTTDQSLDAQVARLLESGCTRKRIFKEKISGKSRERPKLLECLKYVREGDTLLVTRLDRLARSTLDLHTIASQLQADGVGLKVIDQPEIDTTTHTGKLVFGILACISEFETDLRKERQLEGVANAKERGVKFGRKSKLTPEQKFELIKKRSDGMLIRELMCEYQISKATVYRLLDSAVK
jgi:DNA invertase Pin-like site-specific DNA recombinase